MHVLLAGVQLYSLLRLHHVLIVIAVLLRLVVATSSPHNALDKSSGRFTYDHGLLGELLGEALLLGTLEVEVESKHGREDAKEHQQADAPAGDVDGHGCVVCVIGVKVKLKQVSELMSMREDVK